MVITQPALRSFGIPVVLHPEQYKLLRRTLSRHPGFSGPKASEYFGRFCPQGALITLKRQPKQHAEQCDNPVL
ncbi:MAG: hypothetical protein AB1552_10425 [Nitrospirota bacterium]